MEKKTVMSIYRNVMRGGDAKIVLVCGEQTVTIQPSETECYKFIAMLTGGPVASMTIPAEYQGIDKQS